MPYQIDDTHDPKLESWVESANDPETDFPIQNLPLCSLSVGFHEEEEKSDRHIVGDPFVRIGNSILNIQECFKDAGVMSGCGFNVLADVQALASLDSTSRGLFRKRLSEIFSANNPKRKEWQERVAPFLYDVNNLDDEVFEWVTPICPRDYTDFYASLYHATNVGSMFRPDNPLLPNYKHIPIAYHGRASTIVPSGTPVRRPWGQLIEGNVGSESRPTRAPCKLFDYELEVGFVVGRGNERGEPISIEEAEDHILGMCLVNDWSARDIQKWEYQPLGPFLAKNFATTVSPYIVTMEALAPFRCPAMERPAGDPTPLGYLTSEANTASGGVDITLEVFLSSAKMREQNIDPVQLSKGSFKDMYWTIAQMLTHHASGGCQMNPGDLLASGTVSGPTRGARGCMLELTWDGDPFASPPVIVPGTQRTPIKLPTGEERKFLGDGDEIIIKGYCEREGFRRIGFGECRGVIQPAVG